MLSVTTCDALRDVEHALDHPGIVPHGLRIGDPPHALDHVVQHGIDLVGHACTVDDNVNVTSGKGDSALVVVLTTKYDVFSATRRQSKTSSCFLGSRVIRVFPGATLAFGPVCVIVISRSSAVVESRGCVLPALAVSALVRVGRWEDNRVSVSGNVE